MPRSRARACVSGNSASGNARRSSTWIVRRSDTARPATESRVADMVSPMLVTTGSVPYRATSRRTFPSSRKMSESMPPQTRAAFSATTSRTGCRSVGELAMIRRISPVAVCCSRDSVTCAWLRERPILLLQFGEQAHVLDGDHRLVGERLEERDLLGRERMDLGPPRMMMTPSGVPSRSRGVASIVRMVAPVSLMRDTVVGNSASAAKMSSTWIVRRSMSARPAGLSRLTGTVSPTACDRRSDP